MNPDPKLAPPDRKFRHLFPVSRDNFWLLSDDDDQRPEDDGRNYTIRLLRFYNGAWTQTPFHGGNIHALAGHYASETDFDLVTLEWLGAATTFTAQGFAVAPILDATAGAAGKPYTLEALLRAGGSYFAGGSGRRFFHRGEDQIWRSICPRPEEAATSSQSCFAIAGLHEKDIYAAGSDGELWHFDGASWSLVPSAPFKQLTGLCVAAPDLVYACGSPGILLKGGRAGFTQIARSSTPQDGRDLLRSLAFFQGRLYAASNVALYVLEQDEQLKRLDFPVACSEFNDGNHQLHSAGGLLWSQDQLQVRVSENGVDWTTLAQLPGEPPEEEEPERAEPRRAKASELKGLSSAARAFYLDANGSIDEEARVSEQKVKAALKKHGYPAHPKALAFDKQFAGLMTMTNESDGELYTEQAILLGIHSSLEGRLASQFGANAPPAKDRKELTPPIREAMKLARERTPLGMIEGGAELSLFMDKSGAVHLYSDIQGEWFPGAKSGLEFLEQFVVDYGPARAAKK